MAIAHVTSSAWQETGATTYTRAFDCSGGTKLVVGIITAVAGADAITVTYNGTGMTEVTGFPQQSGIWLRDIFYLDSPASGSNNLVVANYAANRNICWAATSLTGAETGTGGATNQADDSGGSYTSSAISLTTTVNNSWHYTIWMIGGDTIASEASSSDSTIRATQAQTTNGMSLIVGTDLKATAGADTNTISWSTTSDNKHPSSWEIIANTSSISPSASPSSSPSISPSKSPSNSPSASPSISPSKSPSISPSNSPSQSPSSSVSPSNSPSQSPSSSVSPSASPSASPSMSPSSSFSISPSASPSISPSNSPSQSPSASISPSASPSTSPSISPSQSPSSSISPSISPSTSPSISPSASPSRSPSQSPSQSPSASVSPSKSPSQSPSASVSPSPSPATWTYEDEHTNPTWTYEDTNLE